MATRVKRPQPDPNNPNGITPDKNQKATIQDLDPESKTLPHEEGEEAKKQTKTRAQNTCENCGQKQPTNIHHRKPRQKGGTTKKDTPQNLTYICGTGTTGCHGTIHANPKLAQQYGHLIKQTQNPETTPILHRGHWALLTPQGTIQHLGYQPQLPDPRPWRALFNIP